MWAETEAVSSQPSAISQKKATSHQPPATSLRQEPRAKPKGARKYLVFRILPASLTGSGFYRESFLPAQWNQDFTGYWGEGGGSSSGQLRLVEAPAFMRGKPDVFMKRALAPGLKPAIEVRPLFPRINPRASTQSRRPGGWELAAVSDTRYLTPELQVPPRRGGFGMTQRNSSHS